MLSKIIIICFISFSSFAVVFLDIEITHEKGLDEKMILKSELSSRERADHKKEIFLQMKNGIQLRLLANFDEKGDEIGPGSVIMMKGILQDISAISKEPKTFDLNVKVNESGQVEFKSKEGQKTRVKVTPRIK